MSGRKQWNKQAATSSFLGKKTPQSLIQQGLEGSTVVGKDEVTSSNLVSSSRTTPEIFGFQVLFVIKINLGSRRAPALQNAMRECFSVADIIRYAEQHIGVVGDDAVYAPGDHIFHVLLVIYRPGVDLHAPVSIPHEIAHLNRSN